MMTDTPHVLGDLSVARFLAEHWQKRPLLVRQALPGFEGPLSADELAGLALEDEVESRIVLETGGATPWELRRGPFTEEDFARLPTDGWSLLVQAVDHWVPEVADLLRGFRFIPNWRIDDVMVSYAPEGGSVGPHYDQYDVFLLQGAGRRRWRIGGPCDVTAPLVEGTPLRILRNMETVEEWLLEPGDMLYLPPGIAHHGTAEGADGCLTYSIGFRAPTTAELLAGLADFAADREDAQPRYADPDLAAQDNPGEITPAALGRVRALIAAGIADDRILADWFGAMMTEPKIDAAVVPSPHPPSATRLRNRLAKGATVRRNGGSRFAYVREGADAVRLFVDGRGRTCTGAAADLARLLCAEAEIAGDRIPVGAEALELIAELIAEGSLEIG